MGYTPNKVVEHFSFDPKNYPWDKYRTDDVLGCAIRLLQEFAAWMEKTKAKKKTAFNITEDLNEHLGMARMMLSDALRDAGLDDERVHTAIAFKSVMTSEEIADKRYQQYFSPTHKEFETDEQAKASRAKHRKKK